MLHVIFNYFTHKHETYCEIDKEYDGDRDFSIKKSLMVFFFFQEKKLVFFAIITCTRKYIKTYKLLFLRYFTYLNNKITELRVCNNHT